MAYQATQTTTERAPHRGARARRDEALYEATDPGRPIGRERPRGLDMRLGVDDSVILLGILLGGAAGWAAAATLNPGVRLVRRRAHRPGHDGGRRRHATHYEPHVEDDETPELIASNKVEGTTVYDRKGEKIGKVHNFMVTKRTGRVAYAVVSIGGFLGIGDKHHALPWALLDYDEGKGGYVVDADKDRLLHAPTHGVAEDALARPEHLAQVRGYWSRETGPSPYPPVR